MVFFDSDPAEVGTKGAADEEEQASFSFSCLTPKRWKKGGKDSNELSGIVDERLDKNVKASNEEEREAKDSSERAEVERAAGSDVAQASGKTGVGADKTQHKKVPQDMDDEAKVPVTGGTKEGQAVTFAAAAAEKDATVVASPSGGSSSLEMPAEEEDVAGKSLLKLSKTKPKKTKPKPKPQTPKRALFDDIPDDESEASIEVLFRYMGCTHEAYGERYQNPTISATLTMDTIGTYETSGDDNDLIENIETIESADNNDVDANDDDGADIESDEDIGNDILSCPSDVLSSPSGNLLMETDENDNDKADEPTEINDVKEDEEKEIANKKVIPPDDQPNDTITTPPDDQPNDTTPPDKQSDGTPPFDDKIVETQPTDEQIDKSAPNEGQADKTTRVDEQSDDNAPTAAQLDGTDEHVLAVDETAIDKQTSSAKAKPVFTRLTVDTKPYDSSIIPPQEDSRSPVRARSAAMDKVATIMAHSALSPSVRKIALALHNAPKYPTTVTGDNEDAHVDNDFAKTEDTSVTEKDPVNILNASGPMSKVEEMDKLIQSTRAWLETQKAERKVSEKVQIAEVKVKDSIVSKAMSPKVMDNVASKAMSPTNTTNTALPNLKKLDTSLPVIKSPVSTKAPSSKAQPLSPRTLDSLLLSRKTTPSDGPKKSILEQLEEIRTKQREREALSPRSPRSS